MKGRDKARTDKRRAARTAKLTHLDERGAARMVDVSDKGATVREAVAGAAVTMKTGTLRLILDRKAAKGDVLAVARVAGIMAAKRASSLIPMCHPLSLSSVAVDLAPRRRPPGIDITVTVRTVDRTGVEMEALVAAAAAALTVYDMCKSVDRAMTVTGIRLLKKTGGKSGTFLRK